MSDNETQPFPSASSQSQPEESADMTSATTPDAAASTTALVPIPGSRAFEQHVTIDPNAPLELSVANASGRVEVVATDTQTVHVIVKRTDHHPEHEDEPQIVVAVDGNSISVRPSWAAASGISAFARKLKDQLQNGLNTNEWKFEGLRFSPDFDYDIWVEVPRTQVDGSRFNVKTASGRATVHGLRDTVSIATASGKIEAEQLDGQIAIHSASGSISLTNITGKLDANTASGSISLQGGEAWTALRSVSGGISIDRFTLKNARITSVSGSIKGAAIVNNTTDYQFETVSGSVKMNLILPADSTTTLDFKSMSGSAKPNGFTVTGKNAWSIGSGPQGPALKARTVSGSLRIEPHLESSIPTRHDAPPQAEPASFDHDHDDDDVTAAFAPRHPERPQHPERPMPPVPPVPPMSPRQSADPLFTPPTDWPEWAKATARSVEETARHVVSSFQQPVTPFDAPDAARMDADRARIDADRARVDAERGRIDEELARVDAEIARAEAEAERHRSSVAGAVTDAHAQITNAARDLHQSATEAASGMHAPDATPAPEAPAAGTPVGEAAEAPKRSITFVPKSADQETPETAAADTVQQNDAAEAERLRILEAVERGEIDIDEALARIESNGKS